VATQPKKKDYFKSLIGRGVGTALIEKKEKERDDKTANRGSKRKFYASPRGEKRHSGLGSNSEGVTKDCAFDEVEPPQSVGK